MRAPFVFAVLFGFLFFGCVTFPGQCTNEYNYVCGENGVTYQNPCYASQAGASIAYYGECGNVSQAECYDSDNGKNLLEQGTTQLRGTAQGQTLTDFCIGSTGVQEYYCENNQIKLESMTCPAGTMCQSGSCTSVVCTDSDSGYDLLVKGTVRLGNESYTDRCDGTANVIEYVCGTTNDVLLASLACPAGKTCSDGACVQPACSDTDGGNDIYERGSMSYTSSTYTDYCTDTNTVMEYSCDTLPDVLGRATSCGSGYSCTNGACVALICTDSDGGRDKDTFGRTALGSTSYDDWCYDNRTVNEYYCDGSRISEVRQVCDGSDVCLGGECRAPGCTDSDGGNVPLVAGTATVGASTYPDSCSNLTRLKEYYCSASSAPYAYVNCYTYFGSPYYGICWNNVCTQTYCQDSDSGQDEGVQGSARMYTTSGYDTGWNNDVCVDSTHLTEWYCDGSWRTNTTITCELDEYCSGGRCIEATCSDTDGGLMYIVAGSVTKGGVYKEDGCLNSTTLREWYCVGNNPDSVDYTCPAGCNSAQRRCTPL